jgi:hypothetical protein
MVINCTNGIQGNVPFGSGTEQHKKTLESATIGIAKFRAFVYGYYFLNRTGTRRMPRVFCFSVIFVKLLFAADILFHRSHHLRSAHLKLE